MLDAGWVHHFRATADGPAIPSDVEGELEAALEVPPLAHWIGDAGAEPWLQTRYEQVRSSPDPIDRVAGVGLVARLWEPPDAAGRRHLLAIRRGEPRPSDRVRAWTANVPPASWRDIEGWALHRCTSLQTGWGELAALLAEDEDAAAARRAVFLVELRDDLDSVALVLRLAGHGATLTRALERSDDEAAVHGTALMDAWPTGALSDRLRALACIRPDAWWSELGP